MKRRNFFGSAVAAGVTGASHALAEPVAPQTNLKPGSYTAIPDKIAGLLLEDLRDDYRDRLMNQYLPFWEKGGYDAENGGFMCYLYDNGKVENDQKDIWYQGRGIWVYSFLYNNIDRNPKWLGIAKKSRDFMVKNMHRGDGTFIKTVNRQGKPVEGIGQGSSDDIYGAMFAAAGLVQYAKAAQSDEDLELAKRCIRKSVERYNDPEYTGVRAAGVEKRGLRAQGHSFMMVWTLPQLLELDNDPWFDALAREHIDLVMNKFWNDDYGISNEILFHDYSRIPSLAHETGAGHTIETQWMAMTEALREKNGTLFSILKNRIRRMIEMNWDYIFEGIPSGSFRVFKTDNRPAGVDWSEKSMWIQVEGLVGTMMTLEYTGDVWAKEWYERVRAFTLRTMTTDYGVWRQAVDRYGENVQRPGISIYRKGNFHQPRYHMMNLLSLDRMIKNKGKLTPFPL